MSDSDAKEQITCPYCGATCSYSDFHHAYDGSVSCQNCGKTISSDGGMVFKVEKARRESKHPDDGLLVIMAVSLLLFGWWIVAIPVVLCVFIIRVSEYEPQKTTRKEGLGID